MTPIEHYEAQQRALETERFARLARELEEDAKQPANFCADYDDDHATVADWLIRLLFVAVMAGLFMAAGLWVTA